MTLRNGNAFFWKRDHLCHNHFFVGVFFSRKPSCAVFMTDAVDAVDAVDATGGTGDVKRMPISRSRKTRVESRPG